MNLNQEPKVLYTPMMQHILGEKPMDRIEMKLEIEEIPDKTNNGHHLFVLRNIGAPAWSSPMCLHQMLDCIADAICMSWTQTQDCKICWDYNNLGILKLNQ